MSKWDKDPAQRSNSNNPETGKNYPKPKTPPVKESTIKAIGKTAITGK